MNRTGIIDKFVEWLSVAELSAIKKIYRTVVLPADAEYPCVVLSDFSEEKTDEGSGTFDYDCTLRVTLFTQIDTDDENPLYGEADKIVPLFELIASAINTQFDPTLKISSVRINSASSAVIDDSSEIAQKQFDIDFILKGVSI